jgi:hypothetical protein
MRNIKIYSALAGLVLQEPALLICAFLWCSARLLDEKGRGWVRKQDLLCRCPDWQAVIETAETPFWVMDKKGQRLFLKSNRKVLGVLQGYPLRQTKVYHLMTLDSLSSLEVFQQALQKL